MSDVYDRNLPVCEDEVCHLVAGWFKAHNFTVEWVRAGRLGLDIKAVHNATKLFFIVEAKGATNSKLDSPHYGREYDQAGAYTLHHATTMQPNATRMGEFSPVPQGRRMNASRHIAEKRLAFV